MTGVIPLSDASRRPATAPAVTVALIAVNVAVFVAELVEGEAFVLHWSAVAADITAGHRVYTLLTSMFLHGSWSHIVGNMVFLWAFGPAVEDALGHLKYLLFYLCGGVAAMGAQVLMTPHATIPMLGASGAIAAVMGSFLVMYPRDQIKSVIFLGWWVDIRFIPAALLIGVWFLLQLISVGVVGPQNTGGVAFVAHAAGLIFGALITRLFEGGERATA